MTDKPKETNESRRQFIKNTGLVAGGLVGGTLFGGLLTNQFQKKPEIQDVKNISGGLQEARVFINRARDFDILSAATERIFPKDDLGPGAIELSVPYFIDKQLASEWGTNAKEYMKGPFISDIKEAGNHNVQRRQDSQGPNSGTQIPTPSPRYHTILNRGEMFTLGLRKMDEVAQKEFGKGFVELDPDKQDEVLHMFEEDKVEMKGVGSSNFFHLLLQTTIEGAYADPVYGGNKDMMGWKMKEYPGPQMGYLDKIGEEKFIKMEPTNLRNYQGH
ncbi:gluconate 2-dehydrogenase subunit 3 family protein [Cytobacillus dafuensis]|uniref:Gluconate 2-dehydrogenase subunit 3 family protein n=1 Tax=Cytobacillus dafuensis TaxID=1742359 RepID=A0A5B8YZ86_CYTDA|nr:gluconate 2-dehydrogenase subunit 3 family protein [Cytobacillus dafuensis]QED45982.1 gluconate 2-dehydrogenase subunit 3 family protein [Cytobacillus dafuensis]